MTSSVSPERCEITAVQPARCAISTAASVSVSVPIWFTFTRIEFAIPSRMPRASRVTFVTNTSSPTIWMRFPSFCASVAQPAQSSSARPSSMLTIG